MAADLLSELVEKAEAALVSAIEVYNKPDFRYREESFSILCVNAWELLLKARLLHENEGNPACLYEYHEEKGKDGAPPKRVVRPTRSGNPLTVSIGSAIGLLGAIVPTPVKDNLFALIEIRDNATHFVNPSFELRKRVLEVGTAAVRNYLRLVQRWFARDLSRLNLYLMPIGFLATSTVATAVATDPDERRLLDYLKHSLVDQGDDDAFSVALDVKIQLKRVTAGSPDSDGTPRFVLSNDPTAQKVFVTEDDIRKTFTWTYEEMRKRLSRRYSDFKENKRFHALKKSLMGDSRYVHCRFLDPKNTKSGKKDFYNPNIMTEFDKHYTLKAAPADSAKHAEAATRVAEARK